MSFRAVVLIGAAAAVLATSSAGWAGDPVPYLIDEDVCESHVAEPAPAPSNPSGYYEFLDRDTKNQNCAYQRPEDQSHNRALISEYLARSGPSFVSNLQQQVAEPRRLRITAARTIPGLSIGDPYTEPDRWSAQSGGTVLPVRFIATNTGARLSGEIWLPPSSKQGPYPGVIIATGASQQHRGLYRWAAQGLAEEGYQVLTFDFQAQGDSENFDHNTDGSYCSTPTCMRDGIPPDNYGDARFFHDQLKDAIKFLFSTPSSVYGLSSPNYDGTNRFNPAWSSLKTTQVGIAAHALGAAAAVSEGQKDQRIKAIVAWGATGPIPPDVVSFAHAPQLFMESDYSSKGPQPVFLLPPTTAKEDGFRQLSDRLKIDTMQISLRASTAHDWAYIPGRPASRYGERIAMYYTLAWFDAYLKGIDDDAVRTDAFARLVATQFDDSADLRSRGAGWGRYDPNRDTFVNVPYRINGKTVANHLSYIYRSMYWLNGGGRSCENMRLGC